MIYVSDPDFTLHVGDVREVLRELPDESVHCCVTSPPYWGLRDYGESQQIGLEPTPERYVSQLVSVFAEVRRVLRSDGTFWLNLGDSYTSGGRATYDHNPRPGRAQRPAGRLEGGTTTVDMATIPRPGLPTGLKPKDLVGIPWRTAFALQSAGWYLRADVIWAKPNPMPESVTDRPTKAHEYLFLLTKSSRYFYDAEAIKEEAQWRRWGTQDAGKYADVPSAARFIQALSKEEILERFGGRRNARSVWEMATEPYAEAHFATFPPSLPERCINAGTSEHGCCPDCGAHWLRIIERPENIHPGTSGVNDIQGPVQRGKREDGKAVGTIMRERHQAGRDPVTVGWRPGCDHGKAPTPTTVLDPFMGSGTTALVARRLGRKSIGIELNPEYAKLAAKRLQQLSLLADAESVA